MTVTQAPNLLTPREAAKHLAISEKKLWSLTSPRGALPAVRLGRRSVRYSPESLAEYVRSQQQTSQQ